MNPTSKYSLGLRFGLITGFLYVSLLFLRYKFYISTPPSFSLFAIISYFIILMMYLITGILRKKQLGGYAEIKDIFQSIFITILITELFYVLFNFIYLKYADPGFLENFQGSALAYYKKLGYTTEQINMEMKDVRTLTDGMKPEGMIKGFGTIVVIDSIFGFIFAAILRKKKPISEELK